MKKISIIIGICLIASNIPPLKPFLEVFFSPPYRYTTRDYLYDGYEYNSKGKTYEEMIRWFERYKKESHQPKAVLYRRFEVKPYKFWLWGEYLFHPKYRLPYLPPAPNRTSG